MSLRLRSVAALLLVFASAPSAAGAASAETIPGCEAPPPGSLSRPASEIPAAVLGALRKRFGDIALPGDAFNATDVVQPGAKVHRILFVWTRGTRWVVATEHGGRGYSNAVLGFDVLPGAGDATLVAEQAALPNTLCEAARALLTR